MFEPNALGSIDVLLLTFEPGTHNFSGAVADELAVLAEAGFIRVLDVRILVKDLAGAVADFTLDEMPGDDRLPVLDHPVREIFTARALARLAAAVAPGRTAGAVAYLNTWASSLGRAVRRSGGRVLATGQVATWAASG
ncbi:MAG: DUF1269 domain-containing protein [Actinomycetota bacterium]